MLVSQFLAGGGGYLAFGGKRVPPHAKVISSEPLTQQLNATNVTSQWRSVAQH